MMDKGLLLNLTGDGKGKTTGALGIAIRALGWGQRVAFLQFMKDEQQTGEKQFFARCFPDMIFEEHGCGLLSHPGDHAGKAAEGWKRAAELLQNFPGELLILDELNNALFYHLLQEEPVIQALKNRRQELNVVVTGRNSPPALREISDLVSEIRNEKHPFQLGIPARKGVDF